MGAIAPFDARAYGVLLYHFQIKFSVILFQKFTDMLLLVGFVKIHTVSKVFLKLTSRCLTFLKILVDLTARILALIPPWTRVYRVQRDIPMPLVTSGVRYGNLREHALARMKQLGISCRDVRTREVGIQVLFKNF